jgi:hypothetical protein
MESLTREIYYTTLNETSRDNSVFGWIQDTDSPGLSGTLKKMNNLLYNKNINEQYFVTSFVNDTSSSTLTDSSSIVTLPSGSFNNFIQLKNDDGTGTLVLYDSNTDELFTNIELYNTDGSTITIRSINYTHDSTDVKNIITILYDFYSMIYNNNKDDNDIKLNEVIKNMKSKYGDSGEQLFTDTNINIPSVITSSSSISIDNIFNNHLFMINELNIQHKDDLNETLFIYYNFMKVVYQKLQLYILTDIYYCHMNNDLNISSPDYGSINTLNRNYRDLIDHGIIGIQNSIEILQNTYQIATGLLIDIDNSYTSPTSTPNEYRFTYDTTSDLLLQMIYENIDKDKHVLISNNENDTFLIQSDVIKTDTTVDDVTTTTLTLTLDRAIPAGETQMRINFKRAHIRKLEFENKKDELKELNKKLNEKQSDYKKALTEYNTISLESNKLYIISMIFYILFVFILMVLLLGEIANIKDDMKSLFSLIMIVIFTSLYIVYMILYNGKERFSQSQISDFDGSNNPGTLSSNISYFKEKIHNKCVLSISNIYSYYNIVALNEVYLNIFNTLDKDKDKLLLLKKTKEYKKIEVDDYSNSIWLEQYRDMTYITMIFLLSLIVLIYYWLSVMYPEGVSYWITMAIIALIIVLFNYYRMISQRIRTKSKKFYWSS